MEKQTKILIGLAVLGAAAYFIFRPKGEGKSEEKGSMPDFTVKCKDGTTDVGNGAALPCQGHGGVLGGSKLTPYAKKNAKAYYSDDLIRLFKTFDKETPIMVEDFDASKRIYKITIVVGGIVGLMTAYMSSNDIIFK